MNKYGADRLWPFAAGGGGTIIIFTFFFITILILWLQFSNIVTGIFLVVAAFLWLLVLYFFRDPNREVVDEPGQVIGPGDGEVVEIREEEEMRYLNGRVLRISIFLNLTDVHVQRVPYGGEVMLVEHQPGKFLQAFRPEASDVNEYVAMIIKTAYGRILIKQIAGILARRCLNYMQQGDSISTGQRFGLIRFSSRLDLYLPPTARLLIKVGDKVIGGITPIAQLEPQESIS